MAGSFDVFRKYQRSLLVAVAILAMLAFFVLPPFLQMGGSTGAGDPVAARWSGGEIREGQLERSVAMRSVVNRFLVEAAVAAGRDPSRLPLFPEAEEAVVRTVLVNEEARRNGLAVSDTAINDFLAQWTNNLVRPEQLAEIIGSLRLGPAGVSQHDLFEALRAELTARNMLFMFQTGFSGDPPGWRWDYYKRLEQKAGVEVVPVPVESVAADVPAPSDATLRAFFEKYKDELPDPRSAAPGFRRPRRAKYEYFVAKREAFEAEAAKEVTDAEIAAFYEKNKATMFRAEAEAKTPAADAAPKADTPAAETPKPAEPAKEAKPAGDKQGAGVPRARVQAVAFRQPAPAKPPAAQPAGDTRPAADTKPPAEAEAGSDAKEKGSEKEPTSESAVDFEPLDKVKDRIREQLAREKADARIDAVFTAIAGDVGRYAEDLALWKARGTGAAAPAPPDVDLIAKKQGLEAGRSELVTAERAISTGGIGQSFELVPDPGSRFGIRQRNWIDSIFGQNTMPLRPVTSRDVAGDRYLSWKTEDQPEFVPSFAVARAGVEQAWRIVEGRPLARKVAEEIVAKAASGGTLAAVVAERKEPKLEAATVGPFSWLSRGSAQFGSAPSLSQPDGLSMPGVDFMEAVFALPPGGTTVVFNEPQTVCYAVRLVSYEPDDAKLREQFIDSRTDQRRLMMVAQQEEAKAVDGWIKAVEKRYALEWKRPPRSAR